MPKYLIQVKYTAEGARGVHKDGGTKRRDAAQNAAKSLGGNIESFHFSFGTHDVVTVVEMPDAVSMAALSMAVSESGAAEAVTTALLTVEDLDHACGKHSAYKKPGA
jgi:uncharacterized protein with GYD domain